MSEPGDYVAVPITDTRPYRSEGFTTLLGAELHAPATALGEDWHILAVGLPPDFPPRGPSESGFGHARRAMEARAFVGIAHPAWYGLTPADAESLKGAAHAVEVYNHSTSEDNDRGDGWYLTRRTPGRRLPHRRLRGSLRWVQVRSESLEPEAILTALEAGRYYSSQGPEIHAVEVGEGGMIVACSPAPAVFLGGRGTARARVLGKGITE